MRISHRYKLIFFANPKTGSSTVRQFLDPYCDVRSVKQFQDRTAANPFYPHMRAHGITDVGGCRPSGRIVMFPGPLLCGDC